MHSIWAGEEGINISRVEFKGISRIQAMQSLIMYKYIQSEFKVSECDVKIAKYIGINISRVEFKGATVIMYHRQKRRINISRVEFKGDIQNTF